MRCAELMDEMPPRYFPFQGGSNQELCRKIVKGRFDCASFMSSECRDLVRRMLTVH
jgi:hypothetical protein